MDRKTLIIIIIAAIVIIVCLVFGLSSKNNENVNVGEDGSQINKNVSYNEVTDETTGQTYYQIYNEESGEVMHNVIDEASLQMYIDNPDFVGPENEESLEGYSSQTAEYNEDGSVIETNEIIE